jgi:hypothetical protein
MAAKKDGEREGAFSYLTGREAESCGASLGMRSCATRKIPVKSAFAIARFLRNTQDGRGEPRGPAQMDCQKPRRDFSYIGLPIHAAVFVMR